MRLLILGGTAWLGRITAQTALDVGHEVTCLARGMNGSVPVGAHHARADREKENAYEEVASQHWDAVVDVARQPGHVKGAIRALSDSTARSSRVPG